MREGFLGMLRLEGDMKRKGGLVRGIVANEPPACFHGLGCRSCGSWTHAFF